MAPPTHARLTPRERTLIAEILAGRTNKAIADTLSVREQTVKNQLRALFRKLQVSSRLELAARFATRDVNKP